MNNTLLKGLALLEVLAHAERAMGVTDLATQAGLGKSHAHRLLQGLVEAGYVRQEQASGSYATTIKLWELGSVVMAKIGLKQLAEPFMVWLLAQFRETVHLSVLDGDEVVYIHKLDSPEPVRAYSQVGGRAPAYSVATGKSMLAYQSPAYLEAISHRLRSHSPRTITKPVEFLREMEKVREQGYAVNRGEWRESVGGCAAPIFDPAGGVIASIGLSGPIDRLRPSMFKAMSAHLITAATGIGAEIGGGVKTFNGGGLPPDFSSSTRQV